jgi:GTP-binding protein Era
MKSGFVSFLGRPNAGKSTLLNRIVGQKLAIVSDKPQTTRTRVVGVKNYEGQGQVVFVDTPGVHKPTHRMNVRMVDVALEAMRQVDVLCLVVDAAAFGKGPGVRHSPGTERESAAGSGDQYMLDLLKDVKTPAILALNKVDLIAKNRLLPIIEHYRGAHAFVEFVPLSAGDGTNVDALEKLFLQYLPDGEPLYPPEYLTDQTDRFFVAEIVREQVLRVTREELPHSTAVIVDQFDETDPGLLKLYCTILVERESQKPIVVGKGGAMIKEIGTKARLELMHHFERKIYLDLHVKVKSEWRNDDRLLDEMGIERHGRG